MAASRSSQHLDADLMTSHPVQLLQSLLAVNPTTATALVAHRISVQQVLDADEAGLAALGQRAAVPLHALQLMQKQLQWGQPLETDAGETCSKPQPGCRGLKACGTALLCPVCI